ncbi:MAG: hypothetical protein M1337_08850, partial [Actinobacteria bacterium]|nr:hypothetical protein [Actinomycetota bacterium]
MRDKLITWSRDDITGAVTETMGIHPRLDAFASLLSIPGAANDLVDVNDMTKDGNQRMLLGPGNVEITSTTRFSDDDGYYTQPDGRVDMRDFRRFRDA